MNIRLIKLLTILILLPLSGLSCASGQSVTKDEIQVDYLEGGTLSLRDCFCLHENDLELLLKEAGRD